MCRWMAWSGQPLLVEELLFNPVHGLIDLQRLRDEDRVVVSEPLADLTVVWHKLPESSVLVVQPGADEQLPFRPHYEPAAGNGAPPEPTPTVR